MRDLNDYDIIFVDIDDTLVYGFWTDLMRITWDLFHNEIIGRTLMFLQSVFNIYKLNMKLYYAISNCYKPVVFLTVRAKSKSTERLIKKIFDNNFYRVVALGTENGKRKITFIKRLMKKTGHTKPFLIDDNIHILREGYLNNISVLQPQTGKVY